jgi:peptidoglycan/LPS O-acetylase OafA/YrhL
MVRIGKVSYGMYLFHWAILVYVCNRLFVTENLALKILFFIPYTLIVYVIAELSFRFYESRFLKLKDTLFLKKKTLTKKEEDLSGIKDAAGVLKPISNE